MSGKLKILFIDDEFCTLNLITNLLKSTGFDVITASSGAEAIQIMQTIGPFFMILTDYHMPVMKGTELLQYAKHHCPVAVRALTSGGLNSHDAKIFIRDKVCDCFLPKPWKNAELIDFLFDGMQIYMSRINERKELTVPAMTNI